MAGDVTEAERDVGRASGKSWQPVQNNPAASRMAAGSVITQARPIFLSVSPLQPGVIGGHGAADAGGEHVRRADGHVE